MPRSLLRSLHACPTPAAHQGPVPPPRPRKVSGAAPRAATPSTAPSGQSPLLGFPGHRDPRRALPSQLPTEKFIQPLKEPRILPLDKNSTTRKTLRPNMQTIRPRPKAHTLTNNKIINSYLKIVTPRLSHPNQRSRAQTSRSLAGPLDEAVALGQPSQQHNFLLVISLLS